MTCSIPVQARYDLRILVAITSLILPSFSWIVTSLNYVRKIEVVFSERVLHFFSMPRDDPHHSLANFLLASSSIAPHPFIIPFLLVIVALAVQLSFIPFSVYPRSSTTSKYPRK